MLSAIDVPKSKSVTIAFIGLKSMILGLFMTFTFSQIDDVECSDSTNQLVVVYKLFYILGSLLDLFLLFYFIFTKDFNRMEYYILFAFHLIVTGLCVIVAVVHVANDTDCKIKHLFMGAALFLCIIFIVSALIIMVANMYFGLKFAHFGCNIMWTFLWIQSSSCNNFFVLAIGVIHGILSIFGLLCFIVMNLMRKSRQTARFWKQIYAVSIFLMILCYLMSFLGGISVGDCEQGRFFMLTYQKYGIFEIIGTVLLLCYMNS